MVTHIFKDGTTTTELKDVYVPVEIVERIYGIVKKDGNNGRNQAEIKEYIAGQE